MKKNPNRQGFYNHLDDIRNTEKDKDAFLKASRLERHESKREPLRPSDVIKMLIILGVVAICCTVLVLGYLSDNLSGAMFGIIVFSVLVGLGAMIASCMD